MTAHCAFISYRRRDTEDLVGRLFDRLSGYFGPNSVLLDVDALMSGENYRTQIKRLLEKCRVVLVVIGQEWLTAADESGGRRLDNPDDQLRIEVATALQLGRTIIPVLVHGAALPTAEQLPEELQPLAALEPHHLQSGTPFNTDVQVLVERLADCGLRPPESAFPWQAVLLPLGIALTLLAVGVVTQVTTDSIYDFALQQLAPETPLAELRHVNEFEPIDGLPYDRHRYERGLWRIFLLVTLPLAVGPMLIVWGKRVCCLSKERTSAQRHYAQGAGRLPRPKSNKSVLCLALGTSSIATGLVTAIPAVLVGAAAWRELRARGSWMRGRSLVIAGCLTSCLGVATALLAHWPAWQKLSWLAAMEQGEQQLQANQLAEAAKTFDLAAGRYSDDYFVTIARIRQGASLQADGSHDAAVEALSDAMGRINALEVAKPYMNGEYLRAAAAAARQLRADSYDALGRAEEAERDRAGDLPMLDQPEAADGEFAPENEAPPAPPAPIVDPSAFHTPDVLWVESV